MGIGLVAHPQARQLHHTAGQVINAHGLAHVQHKHIPALGHGPSLHDQLRGLGNGHEIPRDVGMGQGDRAILGNLLPKQGHHRTRRTQHIAKAHHGETGVHARLLRHGLQHHFGQSLTGAHHIGGPHGLVGADKDKIAHTMGRRHARTHPGAPHVVAHTFQHVVLYQRHMLVGCCVVNRVGEPGGNNLGHTDFIAGRRQQGHQLYRRAIVLEQHRLQILQHLVKRKLVELYQQQPLGCALHYLATQLLAN